MCFSTLIRGVYFVLILLGLAACAGSADEAVPTTTSDTLPDTNTGDTAVLDTIAPIAPANLKTVTGSTTSSSVQLVWNASTDNIAVTGYRIIRNNTILTTTSSTTYMDSNILPESAYQYSIEAFDSANNTATSGILSIITPAPSIVTTPDTTAPSAPVNLRLATALTSSSVKIEWGPSTDNVAVSGYRIMRDNVILLNTTSTYYTDSNVTPDTAYQYSVIAFDAANNTTSSNTLLVSTLIDTSGVATLNSTPPTENIDNSALTDLSGYKIYYGFSSSALTNSITINNIGLASYVIENLTVNKTYYFSITAVNSLNIESALSNIVIKYISG